MPRCETEDIQNRLSLMGLEVYLNVDKPTVKVKRQYHKAVKALSDARHEFDILNDMKEQAPKEN